MGTLKVDNIQKEDGTAVITDGAIPSTILRSSSVGMVLLETKTVASGSDATEGFVFASVFTYTYTNYKIYYNIREKASTANASNGGLLFRFGSGGSVGLSLIHI